MQLEQGIGNILIDPAQFEQILWNLVINAGQAISKNGMISIRTKSERASDGKDLITLEVEDNGCGIAEGLVEKIFEPYFSTKDADVGTGLGLSTVKGLIETNSGSVEVKSVPDIGTLFRVSFPKCAKAATNEPVVQNATDVNPDAEVSGTVLVCDDEPMLLDLSSMLLESCGLKVLKANSGSSAVELMREFGDQVDLVISDYTMPGMKGRDVYQAISEMYPDVNFMIVTGFATEDLSDLAQAGVKIIKKPFDPEVFIGMARSFCRKTRS